MRYRFDGFTLDEERQTLSDADGPIHVEPQVLAVLRHLIANRDRVVSKEELLDSVWGDRFVSESALTSRLKAARRAVGDDGTAQRLIRTVHGRGYHFVAEVTVDDGDVHPTGADPRPPLPAAPPDLIGRDHDHEGVRAALAECRLVTVCGPGGVGKTTLALAVAHGVEAGFGDGAVFVDLTPARTPGDVSRACADAAGVEGAAASSLDRLAAHLATRDVLVVLDNCEHVLDTAATFARHVLDGGGAARLLATSRAPLDVAGEQLWPLTTLGDDAPTLFVARARRAEPRVDWHADDPRIVDLCRRLDGLPLAVELAAGQLRRYDLDELCARLDGRLTLLARPGRHADGRHDTMAATIDWSYQLLDADEQRLLRRLAVLPAAFGLETVEAIADLVPGVDVDVAFGGLVDKSLVTRRPGSGRYRLLETIRVFALERGVEAGEIAETAEWHRTHVVERVVASSRLDRWMSARLAAIHRSLLDHVRVAFRASLDAGHIADAVELAVGSAFLWRNAIGCAEGREWVDELLTHDLTETDAQWVQILRSDVGQGLGDHEMMFAGAAAAVAAHTGDPAAGCIASHFGALAHLTEPGHAVERLRDVLQRAEASGDGRLVTLMDAFLVVAELASCDYERARSHLDRVHARASDDGYDRFIVHWTGWMLGLAERDPATAWHWIGLQQAFLERTGIVETWISSFSRAFNDAAEGRDLRRSLGHALALAAREGYEAEADCMLALAYAELCAGNHDAAAELLGVAVHGRFNSTAHYVLYRVVVDTPLRAHLSDHAVREAMDRGRDRSPASVLADWGVRAAIRDD